MASGIKKRSGSDYSDGRPGRINYHSEDEYRTITLLIQSTAYDMQDVAHLRDAINELFDGELLLREMRIKNAEVEYESMGQRTGEMQLESPEYVNGKQIKVAQVNHIEIDDTTLVSTFTVEFETTELPYFETIYTTLELHDSGYSATAEKYGLVDNIDDEKVKYRFEPHIKRINLIPSMFEQGSLLSTTGAPASSTTLVRSVDYLIVDKGTPYNFGYSDNTGTVRDIRIFHYDNSNNLLNIDVGRVSGGGSVSFTSVGDKVKFLIYNNTGLTVNPNQIGEGISMEFKGISSTNNFTVYNAGNVTVEPESMLLHIFATNVTGSELLIRNNTTNEEFKLTNNMVGRNIQVNGMIVLNGTINMFRNTNRRFISLAPGDNDITVTGATFNEIRFNFKYLYK